MADNDSPKQGGPIQRGSVRFEVHGLELITKQVRQSGNSGRIYLPPTWVGKRVKIVRLD
ncbi:cytoplasmic protein [Desulfocarbo indianensis]|nr:cytoplasmic protein [Desulfocarbo indianensis]